MRTRRSREVEQEEGVGLFHFGDSVGCLSQAVTYAVTETFLTYLGLTTPISLQSLGKV